MVGQETRQRRSTQRSYVEDANQEANESSNHVAEGRSMRRAAPAQRRFLENHLRRTLSLKRDEVLNPLGVHPGPSFARMHDLTN